jgi:hypothetical protein
MTPEERQRAIQRRQQYPRPGAPRPASSPPRRTSD